MANKNFWTFELHVEDWLHGYLDYYHPENIAVTMRDELGMQALAAIKMNRTASKDEKKTYEERTTKPVTISVHYTYFKAIRLKRYVNLDLSYSMIFNEAVKRIFYREYFMYLDYKRLLATQTGKPVNLKTETHNYMLICGLDGYSINYETLLRNYRRSRKDDKNSRLPF